MQIECNRVHNPFIPDDYQPYHHPRGLSIVQTHQIIIPNQEQLEMKYLATPYWKGYKVTCQLDTDALIKKGVIHVEKFANWTPKFPKQLEYLLSNLRLKIQTPDRNVHQATADWTPSYGGLYQLTNWTQTHPFNNGKIQNELLIPGGLKELFSLQARFSLADIPSNIFQY